jgi:predicted DsbA family dithiol-disulfide isomerase
MIPVHAKPYKGPGTIRPTWTLNMRIDIYSDIVCPWCYLGKRRFELAVAARPQYEPRVTWRPFELNPDMPAEGVDRGAYLAAKIGSAERVAELHAALRRQGEASGMEFRFDLIERMPNTRRSHLLMAHAARCGRQSAVMDRVMRAYFEEGCDIGDIEVLVRLGIEAGLSEHETRSALILRAGQDGVLAAERHAAVLGITGVPTFIFDGQYTISGAQDVGSLARILDQVADFAAAREAVS